jgi:crotonobetainyl-CoA:carnitine CoA-transferase CaiB-like acyl-CoA transferase
MNAPRAPAPLAGVRVVEFSQMVMGPSCGLILADLGAEIIKIEPLPRGDRSRYLPGIASGFFVSFNRNKKSLAVNMKSPRGLALIRDLIATSDVVIENFRPGMMARQGLDYVALAAANPRLIYCSLKGFLPGPYENRTALDEVVQMMGGLAFMTGLPGKPMRAGASVNDIMGGMFGVIAIQAALRLRERTGKGQEVQAALFENNAFLMAQSIAAEAITGIPSKPWSVKVPPWPVYDLFDTADGSKLFIAIVGDGQWVDFCEEFGRRDWLTDPGLQTNAARTDARALLIPQIQAIVAARPVTELCAIFERLGLPFAPVRTPGELVDDPHLNASNGMVDMAGPAGRTVRIPAVPMAFDGERLGKRNDPPGIGSDSRQVLASMGLSAGEIDALFEEGVVGAEDAPPARVCDNEVPQQIA